MEFKDWAFVEISPRGEIVRVGHIIDRISEGLYLCQIYNGEATHAEPIAADVMTDWKLFPDKAEMQRYMTAVQVPPATPADPKVPTTLPTATKHGKESTAEDDK